MSKEHLEELVMNGTVDLSEYNISHNSYERALESVIELLSEISDNVGNVLTFGEIVSLTDNVSSIHYEHLTHSERHALNALYPHWVDYEALVNRSDNYLSENIDETDWKVGYNKSLSEYVIRNGTLVQVDPTHFGWGDYQNDGTIKYSKSQVVGAYNVKEIYWSEFAGTFVDADDKIGIELQVLFSNGYSRNLRVEKSMAEIINSITVKHPSVIC